VHCTHLKFSRGASVLIPCSSPMGPAGLESQANTPSCLHRAEPSRILRVHLKWEAKGAGLPIRRPWRRPSPDLELVGPAEPTPCETKLLSDDRHRRHGGISRTVTVHVLPEPDAQQRLAAGWNHLQSHHRRTGALLPARRPIRFAEGRPRRIEHAHCVGVALLRRSWTNSPRRSDTG